MNNRDNRSKILSLCVLRKLFTLLEEIVVTMVSTDILEARIAKRKVELQKSLAQLKANPRVRDIRVIVPAEACPVCQEVAGTYTKDNIPVLPPEGCSCPRGSEAFYQPMLNEIFP